MAKSRPSTTWTQRERVVRLLLAALAVVLGCLSVSFSLAQVLVKRNPALAHSVAPYDGRITARFANSLSGDDGTKGNRRRIDELARLAIRQDATAVLAPAALGTSAELRGDVPNARRLFGYAQHLSRRDLRTQLWAIEDAVRREDVVGALRQHDLTLRVFPRLSEMLYPILAAANGDPAVRPELIKLLATKTSWSDSFINYIGRKGPDLKSTTSLFEGLNRAGVKVPDTAVTSVVNSLIAGGDIDRGWSQYATIRPGANRDRSRDPEFTAGLEAPSRLDWRAIADGGATVTIDNGAFDFAAPATVGGPVLEQLQVLLPGKYRLAGQSTGIDQADGTQPYWTVSCQGGHVLARIALPNSQQARGEFAGVFSVPAACQVQVLALVLQPSDAVTGLSGRIERAQIVPVK